MLPREENDLSTDAEGHFSAPFPMPHDYNMTVRAPGFAPVVWKDFRVRITEVSRLKSKLTIRGVKEQITVTAIPALVETENATLGPVIIGELKMQNSLYHAHPGTEEARMSMWKLDKTIRSFKGTPSISCG